jgi:hypothetical protein
VNGLEVEPPRDLYLEINQNVLGHRIAVGKSLGVKFCESSDRQLDGPRSISAAYCRILQKGR